MIWHNRKLCISKTWHSFSATFSSAVVKNICTIRIKRRQLQKGGVNKVKGGHCVLNAFATFIKKLIGMSHWGKKGQDLIFVFLGILLKKMVTIFVLKLFNF